MRVVAEETIATCEPPNNGAGPLWCYGAPLIVRLGEDVYASVMETGAGVPPLCNTRPRLYRRRRADGWQRAWTPDDFREREPCPLVTIRRDRLFLSVNTSVMPAGTAYGKCEPRLLEFSRNAPTAPVVHKPPYPQTGTFTDHSYRGLAADSQNGEILLLHIDAHSGDYHYTLRTRDGRWDPPGTISFPIRSCYPQVCVHKRAAYVLAIGDIVEPIEEWRRYKRERTQREWDYVFRRLFFTWTPNVLSEPFSPPIEIDNVDATGGHIVNLDLWIDRAGTAHVLYRREQTTWLLRERYFPNLPLRVSLQYCTIRAGRVHRQQTLLEGGEGLSTPTPTYARFHSPDGERLLAVVAVSSPDGTMRNVLMPVLPERAEPTPLPLREPFATFFTACERGGTAPSRWLDLFGVARDPQVLRYACVQL